MGCAGFKLSKEPGVWLVETKIEGVTALIPVDLIVPEGVAPRGGRRAVGLEAALRDHSTMMVSALSPSDKRSVEAEVAAPAALLVAKATKLHERVERGRSDRIDDKDAADVVRIMQVTDPAVVGATFTMLCKDPVAGGPSVNALKHLEELFGRRGRHGIDMAPRALRTGWPEARVAALCVSYTTALIEQADGGRTLGQAGERR
jgi:hypothetical protein